MEVKTKIIRNIIIALVLVLLVVYHGLTIKSQRIRAVRLNLDYQEGKISKQEYERLNRENSYLKAFLNPIEVIKAD